MAAEIVYGILAFVGAGIGSGFGFWATRGATKAEREARRREEWGRRFTAALEAITSSDDRRRAAGRALLVELMRSELATETDRAEAAAVLDAAATHNPGGDLRVIVSPGNLDDVDIVRDTGTAIREGGPDDHHRRH